MNIFANEIRWRWASSLLLGGAAFVACVGPLRPLLNYYEELHLFRWTAAYLREQASMPGGWWELAISFATQFFYVGWLGALVVALTCVALQGLTLRLLRLVRAGRVVALLLSLVPPVLWFCLGFVPSRYRSDAAFRQSVRCDYLVRRSEWESLLRYASSGPLLSDHALQCANYALAMEGRLAEDLFTLEQRGPDALLLDTRHSETLPLFVLSDIFLRLGLINDAERLAFEAKQYLAANQRSGRLYRRLAEANLINGDSAVAARYFKVLEPTLFYRSFARRYSAVIRGEEALDSSHFYCRLRRLRLKRADQLSPSLAVRLEALVRECPDNRLAADYLEACDLLRCDYGRVLADELLIQRSGRRRVPRAVQECVAGNWAVTHPNDSFPIPVSQDVFDQTMAFLRKAEQTRDMLHPSLCQPPYSQSYWHYYGRILQRQPSRQ